MNRTGTLATALSLLLVAGTVEAQPGTTLTRSYLGKPLPDIKADPANWINAPQGGLSLKHFHGRPTLVLYTVLW